MYLKPKESKLMCKKLYEKYDSKHAGNHKCEVESHRCDYQCPECKSFCSLNYGHDKKHFTNTHRNKENSIFCTDQASKEKIEFKVDGKCRTYNIGESC